LSETPTGSTVPRRQLGRYLSELRAAAGLTVKAAAHELERSLPTMHRIEGGRVAVRALDVEQMCHLYRASEDMTKALMALARETKAKGWWSAYGDVVPEWFDLFVGLEAAANRMSEYEQNVVPGLFQTEGYARTLMAAENPGETPPEIERRVELRLQRQAILRRPVDPPVLRVALHEAVLRGRVGGPAVMADQLRSLAGLSGLPNVSMRVVPASAGYHPGVVSGAFIILRFPLNGGGRESEPPTVYQEMYTGALYLDKSAEVARFDTAFEVIWQTALDEESSKDLIGRTAEDMRNG